MTKGLGTLSIDLIADEICPSTVLGFSWLSLRLIDRGLDLDVYVLCPGEFFW